MTRRISKILIKIMHEDDVHAMKKKTYVMNINNILSLNGLITEFLQIQPGRFKFHIKFHLISVSIILCCTKVR